MLIVDLSNVSIETYFKIILKVSIGPVEDIGIHRVCLLLNGEYIYLAVEKKCSFSPPQHCDVEQGILIKGFHDLCILLKKLTAKNWEMLITQRLLQTSILN